MTNIKSFTVNAKALAMARPVVDGGNEEPPVGDFWNN